MRQITNRPEQVDPVFENVLADNQRAVIRAANSLQRVAGNPETTTTTLIQAAASLLEVAHLRGNAEHVTQLHLEAYQRAHEGAFTDA